jgi:hypothetical protein
MGTRLRKPAYKVYPEFRAIRWPAVLEKDIDLTPYGQDTGTS